jgi:DNA polymerase-4
LIRSVIFSVTLIRTLILPVDYQEFARVSAIIKTILRTFSGVMEDVGIDEAFLDISECEKASEQIAHESKERVWDETGLTCSIGIASNKLLAKIASDMQKPDGLTILTEVDIEGRVWPLPVRKLWGVGPKTEAYLKGMPCRPSGTWRLSLWRH